MSTSDDRLPPGRPRALTKLSGFNRDEKGIVRSNLLARGLNALHIEILDHGYFYGDESWNQFGVMSPFARLYFMARDHGWIETADGSVDLEPGKMYLIPPFLKVNLRTDHRIEKFYLHVNCLYAGMNLLERSEECRVLPCPDTLLAQILRAYEGQSVQDLLYLKGSIYHVLGRFLEGSLADLHERLLLAERYREVHAYVAAHLSFKLGYREVATALRYPPDSLRADYAADNGLTLARYIHGQLIQAAALELLTTARSVKEIAADLGFTDEFYFSRFFKKRMQYSPRQYRRLNGFSCHYSSGKGKPAGQERRI